MSRACTVTREVEVGSESGGAERAEIVASMISWFLGFEGVISRSSKEWEVWRKTG